MDVSRTLAALRRHWILLSVAVVLGLLGGAAHVVTATPTYRTTATVVFQLSVKGAASGSSVSAQAEGNSYIQSLMPSYVELATMSDVLSPVAEKFGLSGAGAVAAKVSVDHDPTSVFLRISVVDQSRTRAPEIANAVADQLRVVVDKVNVSATAPVRVVASTSAPAPTPNVQSSPNRNLSLLFGLLGGLILGLAATALREAVTSQPVATRADVARVTETPVLAAVPSDQRGTRVPLPNSTHPTSERAEAFRVLATNVMASSSGSRICVSVTSCLPGEGRTVVATNLAIALSHASLKVLLVDADLQNPSVADLLGMRSDRGLTDILRGATTIEGGTRQWVTQLWGDRTLDVITTGLAVAAPSELLASQAMAAFVAQVRDEYDVVVIDGRPLLQSTDGALLASQVDSTLVVVDTQKVKQRQLAEAFSRVRLAGADVLGVVLNRANSEGWISRALSTVDLSRAQH